MGNTVESWNRRWLSALFAGALLALGPACGDDDSGEDEEEEPDGEPCPAEGQTDNQCTCSADQPRGYRQCTEDLIWTACTCADPPDDNECQFVGQPVLCTPCDGEAEGRMTECLENRTFDCSCGGGSGRDGGSRRDGG